MSKLVAETFRADRPGERAAREAHATALARAYADTLAEFGEVTVENAAAWTAALSDRQRRYTAAL